MRKAMHVENRMVRLGQLVQGEHSENGGEGRAENGELKGDGNKGRPAIERAPANVHRIGDRRRPVLEEKTANTASQAAKETNHRDHVALQTERFRETFDGKGGTRIETAIARLADFFHGVNELLGRLKLTHRSAE